MVHDLENKQTSPEQDELELNLKGSLSSFLGTKGAPFIKEALEGAGITPGLYDPEEQGHENYLGFPVTEALEYGNDEPTLSPIVLALGEKMERGEVVSDSAASQSVRLKPFVAPEIYDPGAYESNAYKLSKLFSVSLESLIDTETGDVLAYAVALSADGGKPGYALISTNDVEPIPSSK